jgi:hypothetical protein
MGCPRGGADVKPRPAVPSAGIALWIGNGGSPSVVSDWANVAEEIEDVGRSELRSCRSLLRQALRHMLKAEAWPLSRDAPTWRADAIDFRRQARDAFALSMRQKIPCRPSEGSGPVPLYSAGSCVLKVLTVRLILNELLL